MIACVLKELTNETIYFSLYSGSNQILLFNYLKIDGECFCSSPTVFEIKWEGTVSEEYDSRSILQGTDFTNKYATDFESGLAAIAK